MFVLFKLTNEETSDLFYRKRRTNGKGVTENVDTYQNQIYNRNEISEGKIPDSNDEQYIESEDNDVYAVSSKHKFSKRSTKNSEDKASLELHKEEMYNTLHEPTPAAVYINRKENVYNHTEELESAYDHTRTTNVSTKTVKQTSEDIYDHTGPGNAESHLEDTYNHTGMPKRHFDVDTTYDHVDK